MSAHSEPSPDAIPDTIPDAIPDAIRQALRRILECGDLETKLAPVPTLPAGVGFEGLSPIEIDRPCRDAEIAMGSGAESLPRPGALGDPRARALCLARFAHHELQATELLAFALLRWPDLPAALVRSWLSVLADEQRHARLYLARLHAHDACLAEHAPHSDYFWKHAGAMAAGGPPAFLAVLGLTLEQANLDFSLLYRDGFRAAGDEASARVLEVVHRDEIGHVRMAAHGLRQLLPEHHGDRARYEASVPFPLSAARAKGRRFDAAARRRAGLEEEFIEHVRTARSSTEHGGRS
ncbi:MAG: DUF455 family protein [Myxococcota bacterium]|nr:DUF455 family protein [Myxococcota bacterium]